MQPTVALLHPGQKGGIDLSLHLSEALAEFQLGRSMALVPEGQEFRPALREGAPVVAPRCMWRGYGGLEASDETLEAPQAIGCWIQTQTDRQPGRVK
jgi:hypothetical protein